MSPEEKAFMDKFIYPVIKQKVREQLNTEELPISVTFALDAEGRDCLNINDGRKVLMLPILTPNMKNVTSQVDIIAFKEYLLSHDQDADQKGPDMEGKA